MQLYRPIQILQLKVRNVDERWTKCAVNCCHIHNHNLHVVGPHAAYVTQIPGQFTAVGKF